MPTSPPGEHSTVWRNPGTCCLPHVYHCAKNNAGFPNSRWKTPTRLRQMHAVLVLFRPLPNVGIQNFGMWGMYTLVKAYRNIQKSIANLRVERTGKPAMVALKIQLDCSTVHETTLWANIYVRSHVGCGTDSVFIRFLQVSQIFQRRKSVANKHDFENKLNLTCQTQSTPHNNRDLNQGILNIWSKFGGPILNGWWVIAWTSSKWGKFWLRM